MNREMKFRWYYDDDFRGRKGMFYFDFDSFGGDGQVFGLLNGIREEIYRRPQDVDVMQDTGLKDKNGKKIYEGDIVRDAGGFNVEVRWENGREGYVPFSVGRGERNPNDCEVIGNVIENPNLLKETK